MQPQLAPLRSLALALPLLAACAPVDDFDPVPWSMDRVPQVAPAANGGAIQLESVAAGLSGPEDIAMDSRGRLYAGTDDGWIHRLSTDGAASAVRWAEVGGRPLGLAFGPGDVLYVANHGVGLQSVDPDGEVRLLADRADGKPIHFADDLHVDSRGVVYLTDASSRFNLRTIGPPPPFALYDFLEGRPYGRVIRYDTATAEVEVLTDDLYFPNGIATTPDETALIVVETTRMRLSRIPLSGPQRGQRLDHGERIAGLGDGLTPDGRGHLMLTAYYPVDVLHTLVGPSRAWRHVLARVPRRLFTLRSPRGYIALLDAQGRTVETWQGAEGLSPAPANAIAHGEWIYTGTLTGSDVVRFRRPS